MGLDVYRDQARIRRADAARLRFCSLWADDRAGLRGAGRARPQLADRQERLAALCARWTDRLHDVPARVRIRPGANLAVLQLAADRDGAAVHDDHPGGPRRADRITWMARPGR